MSDNLVHLPIRRPAKMAEFRELTTAEIFTLSDEDLAKYVDARAKKEQRRREQEGAPSTQEEIDAFWGPDEPPKARARSNGPAHDTGAPHDRQNTDAAPVIDLK